MHAEGEPPPGGEHFDPEIQADPAKVVISLPGK